MRRPSPGALKVPAKFAEPIVLLPSVSKKIDALAAPAAAAITRAVKAIFMI
jgi:hypothetical protein